MFQSDTHINLHQPGIRGRDETPKITKTSVMASLAVSMGSMIVGFCSAWSSPAIASLMDPASRIEVSVNQSFTGATRAAQFSGAHFL